MSRNTALAGVIAAGVFISPATAHAQVAQEDDIGALKAALQEVERREAAAQEKVSELEERLRRLENALTSSAGGGLMPVNDTRAAGMRARYIDSGTNARPSDPTFITAEQVSGGEEEVRKAPAPTDVVEAVSDEQQGRFGQNFGIDLGASYSHFDGARINLDGFLALDAIFLGNISIDRVVADILTFNPAVRVGIGSRLFLRAELPYFYRRSNFRSGGAGGDASGLVEATVTDSGIGDASLSAAYRLRRESRRWPDIVANLRVKIPTGRHPYGVEFVEVEGSEGNLQVPTRLSTGTGVYGLSAGVSLLKTLDPMVVFGSVNYFHNFRRNFDDISEEDGDQPGMVNVGDAIQVGAGLAFALNDRSSINMSYSQRFVGHTKTKRGEGDWREVVGSQANVALVNLGATFSLNPRMSLIFNTGIGLTDDSPDMSLNVRVPVSF